MHCPKCGAEAEADEKFCGSCGNPLGSGKALCDGCVGAFPPAELAESEGRRLCPVCLAREGRRKSGTLGPAPALAPRPFPSRPPVPEAQTSVLAILSLVVSILFPLGVPGLVLGILALLRIRGSGGRLEGKGLAVAGTILSAVTLACWTCMFLAGLFAAVEEQQQMGSAQAQARVRAIAEAEQAHFAQIGRFGTLDELVAAGCWKTPLDETLYKFDAQASDQGFQVTAVPVSGKGPHFLLDEKGTLRHEMGKPATAGSPVWAGGSAPVNRPPRPASRPSGG
jgi:hypothetical protein